MVTTEEAQQQITQARNLIEQKKREALEAEQKLEQARKSIPENLSQTARRTYSREQRRQIETAKQEISSKQQEVQRYKEEVIVPYEQQVSQSEKELSDYNARIAAMELIRKTAKKGGGELSIALIAQGGEGLEQEYAKQYLKDVQANRDFNERITKAVSEYTGGATKEEAFKGINIAAMEKEGLIKFDSTPSEVQTAINNQNLMFSPNNIINDLVVMNTGVTDRTTKIKNTAAWKNLLGSSIVPLASAQEIKIVEPHTYTTAPKKTIGSTIKGLFNIPVAGTGTATLFDIGETIKGDYQGTKNIVTNIITPKVIYNPTGTYMPNAPRTETVNPYQLSNPNILQFEPKPLENVLLLGGAIKAVTNVAKRVKDTKNYISYKSRPYIVTGGNLLLSQVEQTKQNVLNASDKVSKLDKTITGLSIFGFREAKPYVDLVKPSIKQDVSTLRKGFTFLSNKQSQVDKAFSGLTIYGTTKTKPYIDMVTPNVKQDVSITFNFLNAQQSKIDKSLTGLSILGYSKAQPYVKMVEPNIGKVSLSKVSGNVGQMFKDITIGQTKAKAEGRETYNVLGSFDLPTSESSSVIYRTYEGIKGIIGSSATDLYKGLDKRTIGIKAKPYSFLTSETGWQVKTLTQEQKTKEAEQFGKRFATSWDVATYVTPIATVKIAGGLGESVIKGQPIQFIKENPLDVAFLGVQGIGMGLKFVNKPIIETEKLLIKTRKAGGFIGKPTGIQEAGGKTFTYFDEVIGSSSTTKAGRKTIVTSRWREFFGREPIYSGVPYGKSGGEGYNKALQYLTKQGYGNQEAKNILRLRQPSLSKNVFTGRAVVETSEEGTKINLKGFEKSTKVAREVSGVKTRMGEGEFKVVSASGISTGEKGEVELYNFLKEVKKSKLSTKGIPYSKISMQGKSIDTYKVVSGVKESGEINTLRGTVLNKLTIKKVEKPIETIKTYHGTTDKFLEQIKQEGLKPSSLTKNYQGVAQPLEFVSTGTSEETARGFATRTMLKKGGKPIVLEINVPKSEANKFLVDSTKLSGIIGEVRFKEVPSKFISVVGEPKVVKEIGETFVGKELNLKVYKEANAFKRITPLKRGAEYSSANIFVEQIPEGEVTTKITLDTVTDLKGFQGGGKKSSTQFFQNLYNPEQGVSSTLSNVVQNVKINTPSMTGSVIKTESKSFGEMLPRASAMEIKQETTSPQIVQTDVYAKSLVDTKPDTKIQTRQTEVLKSITPQKINFKPSLLFAPKPKEAEKIREQEKQTLDLRQSFKLKQLQRQVLRTRTTQKQVQQPKQPTKPITPIRPTEFNLGKAISKVKQIAQEEPAIFESWITRFGKEVSIGKKLSQKESEELLLGKLRGTLSAGGFITKGGVKLKATELKSFSGGEFRLSKVSPYKIIERQEKRLRRGTTSVEIKAFRKTRKTRGGIF